MKDKIKMMYRDIERLLDMEPGSMSKKSRRQDIVEARWLIISYMHEVKKVRKVTIARAFEHHHCSTLHALKQVKIRNRLENAFRAKYEALTGYFKQKYGSTVVWVVNEDM